MSTRAGTASRLASLGITLHEDSCDKSTAECAVIWEQFGTGYIMYKDSPWNLIVNELKGWHYPSRIYEINPDRSIGEKIHEEYRFGRVFSKGFLDKTLQQVRGMDDQVSHPCLDTSSFKKFYTPTKDRSVTEESELFEHLEKFLYAYAKHNGQPESAAEELFKALQEEIEESVKQLKSEGKDGRRLIAEIAVVLWTSPTFVGFGKEFCSILNHVCRDDMEDVLPSAVVLCRAIATLIVPPRGPAVRGPTQGRTLWPKEWLTHRGTIMPREAVDFFKQDLLYRAPMYLATSCQESVATKFMESGMQKATDFGMVPVHFKFHINPLKKCDHVFYIEPYTQVKEEEELLYAPYSAFKVRGTTIPDGEIEARNPIVIEIDVQPDNKTAAEDVPNSEWH